VHYGNGGYSVATTWMFQRWSCLHSAMYPAALGAEGGLTWHPALSGITGHR
jgi:hypothetical protein